MSVPVLYALYKDDYLQVDDVETITVMPRNPKRADIEDVKAKRVDYSLSDLARMASDVQLETIDIVLVIWDTTLDGYVVKNGDQLEYNGDQYVIVRSSKVHFDVQWQCICRRQE